MKSFLMIIAAIMGLSQSAGAYEVSRTGDLTKLAVKDVQDAIQNLGVNGVKTVEWDSDKDKSRKFTYRFTVTSLEEEGVSQSTVPDLLADTHYLTPRLSMKGTLKESKKFKFLQRKGIQVGRTKRLPETFTNPLSVTLTSPISGQKKQKVINFTITLVSMSQKEKSLIIFPFDKVNESVDKLPQDVRALFNENTKAA